jgi:hypothetical protein
VVAGDARAGHRIDEGAWVVAVVDGVDVDVVDVQQQVAIGLGQDRIDERCLVNRRGTRGRRMGKVGADVLDRDPPAQ